MESNVVFNINAFTGRTCRVLVNKKILEKDMLDNFWFQQQNVKLSGRVSLIWMFLDQISVWGGSDYSDNNYQGWEIVNEDIETVKRFLNRKTAKYKEDE